MNEQVPALARKGVAQTIEISLKGDAATIQRYLMALALAGRAEGDAPLTEPIAPQPLLLTRAQAAARLGRGGTHRLRDLLARGRLRNHGTPKAIMIDPKELESVIGE